MNQPPTPDSPLDRLLDALHSAPTPDELHGEAAAVEAMASAIAEAPQGVDSMRPSRSPFGLPAMTRRARRVVGLTAISVLGVAGVAAAGAGVFVPDNRPSHDVTVDTEHEDDESTEVETSIDDTTPSATTIVDATAVGDDETTEDATEATGGADATDTSDAADVTTMPGDTGPTTSIECADGNHGKTVSSVAHATPPGPDHGKAVSAAAHSDCGKSGSDTTDSSAPETSAPGDTVAGTAGSSNKPADPGSQGKDHKPGDRGSHGNHGPADKPNPGHGNGG